MSRTYRRKNYEAENNTSWDRQYKKVYGRYNTYDYGVCLVCSGRYYKCEHIVDGYVEYVYREMTKEEKRKAVRWAHGESKHGNQHSPSKFYRKRRMSEYRVMTRNELAKYNKFPDEYEPIISDEPVSCMYDWR